SASKALAENNTAMQQLLNTLKARGIAERDIQTSNFSVVPQYKRNPQGQYGPEIVGYQVSNQVHIKVRRLTSLGEILDELVGQGANQIQGISFGVAERNRLLDDARKRAMADARRKAELYAASAGVGVGRVLLIEEQSARPPRPYAAGLQMAMVKSEVP